MNMIVSATIFIASLLLITMVLDMINNRGTSESYALLTTGINLLISLSINLLLFLYFGWENVGKYIVNMFP